MRSASVIVWRANGAGLAGTGCVGHDSSPLRSVAGTGRSSTGTIGLPVARSRPPGEPPRTGPREGETRQQGQGDAEPADKPTARDAHGNKQPGYAESGEEGEPAEDAESVPLGK